MLMEKFKSLKGSFESKTAGNNKRKIENLVVFIIILIATIFIMNYIWSGNDNKTEKSSSNNQVLATTQNTNNLTQESETFSKNELETKLENILSRINGVGNVEVLITYSQTSKTVAMYDEDTTSSTTQEADKSGGTRNVVESSTKKSVIYKDIDGEKEPVVESILQPTVEGAIVTAQGASDVNVKTNIISAVEAVTGLATHKIQVFEMKN